MSFPFVTRRRYETDLAGAKAEASRQRRRAERAEEKAATEVAARREITTLFMELDTEHDKVVHRTAALCTELEELRDAAGIEAQARRQAERIARLQKEVARAREELDEERKNSGALNRQVTALQKQVDDALGLNDPKVAAGAAWQDRREQRMRFDKPSAEEATAS